MAVTNPTPNMLDSFDLNVDQVEPNQLPTLTSY